MKSTLLSLGVIGILMLTSHSSFADPVTLAPVGPKPAGLRTGPIQGYLEVYSATDEYNDGDILFYPHSKYKITAMDGTFVRKVDNHLSRRDEDPERVELPKGEYKVYAYSEKDGAVIVPVIIKGGQVTVVNLDRPQNASIFSEDPKLVVKSPAGQIVGWKPAQKS